MPSLLPLEITIPWSLQNWLELKSKKERKGKHVLLAVHVEQEPNLSQSAFQKVKDTTHLPEITAFRLQESSIKCMRTKHKIADLKDKE